MSKFRVSIEETQVQEFIIEAETVEQAEDIAIEKYVSGEIELDQANVYHTEISTMDESGEELLSDWHTFYV